MFTRVGQPTSLCCDAVCGGGVQEGTVLLAPFSAGFQSPSPATHKQIGPFWCWFPGGWFCVCSRTLWVSPLKSPVRLGVFPTASTPTGFSSQRFEALFPHTGTLGCVVCLAPQLFLLVYPQANVGPPSLTAAASSWLLSTSAARLCPSCWSGWIFLLQLLSVGLQLQFDFLAVSVVFWF